MSYDEAIQQITYIIEDNGLYGSKLSDRAINALYMAIGSLTVHKDEMASHFNPENYE